MMTRAQSAFLVGLCLLGLSPPSAIAGIHTWDVSEVFSNADGTIQFVELVESGGGNGETGVSGGTITSNAKTFTWSSPPVINTANKKYLIATPAFAQLTGAPALNAIITPGTSIPSSSTGGDTVDFSIYDTCTFGVGADQRQGLVRLHHELRTASATRRPTMPGRAGSVRAAIASGNLDNFQMPAHAAELGEWLDPDQPAERAGRGERPLPAADRERRPLGTFNQGQWAGNYVAAAIDHLDVDLNNSGPDPLSIRVMLLTPGCESGGTACTAWTSTNATPLASGSGWVTASFSIEEADLTQVLGSDSYTASLSNIERMLIRHDDDTRARPTRSRPSARRSASTT